MSSIAYRYVAVSATGGRSRGEITAGDRDDAFRRLTARGLRPVRLVAGRGSGRRARARVTLRDLSRFTHQLAVLVEARLPIVEVFRSIAEQESDPGFRAVLDDIAGSIEAGRTLVDSMEPHRPVFGDVYIETVRAAESSGNMIEVLNRLAAMLDRQHTINKNVRGALTYPACVVGALATATVFLMLFVVPKFSGMFAARGLELPLPTRIVIGGSTLLRDNWALILVGIVAAVFALRRAWREPKGQAVIDAALHRIPWIKDVLQGLAIARFSDVLGLCLRSGLGLIDALEMAGRASARPSLEIEARRLTDQVKAGGRLTDVMDACTYLTPFARRLVSAGEQAGELPRMCAIVGKKYDEDVEQLTKNVATVIEPLLIAGLAGVVLLIALAVFLPMWNMAALVG